jgi:hypothetical protein
MFIFHLDEEVTGGKIYLNLTWGSIQVLNTTADLCKTLQEVAKVSCPLSKGPIVFNINQKIPSIVPPVSNYFIFHFTILYLGSIQWSNKSMGSK